MSNRIAFLLLATGFLIPASAKADPPRQLAGVYVVKSNGRVARVEGPHKDGSFTFVEEAKIGEKGREERVDVGADGKFTAFGVDGRVLPNGDIDYPGNTWVSFTGTYFSLGKIAKVEALGSGKLLLIDENDRQGTVEVGLDGSFVAWESIHGRLTASGSIEWLVGGQVSNVWQNTSRGSPPRPAAPPAPGREPQPSRPRGDR